MAISDVRKEWQAFKKAYPEFEKAKDFKEGFGRQLDKLAKDSAAFLSDLKKLLKKLETLQRSVIPQGHRQKGMS